MKGSYWLINEEKKGDSKPEVKTFKKGFTNVLGCIHGSVDIWMDGCEKFNVAMFNIKI